MGPGTRVRQILVPPASCQERGTTWEAWSVPPARRAAGVERGRSDRPVTAEPRSCVCVVVTVACGCGGGGVSCGGGDVDRGGGGVVRDFHERLSHHGGRIPGEPRAGQEGGGGAR